MLQLPDWPAWASRTFLVLATVTSLVAIGERVASKSSNGKAIRPETCLETA